jgi:hypothetical protein
VDDGLWQRVQARKAKTRAHYLRAPDGTLMGKPEAGLAASHLLNGIARCAACGSPLTYMKKSSEVARYYCGTHLHRGACPNGRGVPVDALDDAVRSRLFRMLTEDAEAVAALCEERDARLRSEQAGPVDRREAALREADRLEAEIGRLVAALAPGVASSDATQAIAERRSQVQVLRATPAAPPPFDRAEFFRRFAGARKIAMLIEPSYPAQVRQVLRKCGVERVVGTADADGKTWDFEGLADLGRLVDPSVTKGAPEGAVEAPSEKGLAGVRKPPPATASSAYDAAVLELTAI